MGIKIGLAGLGHFGQAFTDLFRSHPLVDRVSLCDREPERMQAIAARPGWDKDRKFKPRDMYDSLDALLRTDVDAVVIITQPWLHAPQCVQAMEAGKHVYSAVPIIMVPDGDEILDWCGRIVETCRRTGRFYMLGETTYYRAETMFCRRKAAEGAFGHFVYGEGEYFHDVDHNLRNVQKWRTQSASGQEWLERKESYVAANLKGGPMHYPTHSTSGPVAVMKAHAVKVTAHGYANRINDPFFADDAFSNEVAMFRMSNGASVRICEFRELGGSFHGGETFRIIGTRGTYAEKVWKENFRTDSSPAGPTQTTQLSDEAMRDPLPPEVALAFKRITQPDATDHADFTPAGHGGSHPYLVHEFVDAVAHGRQSAINAWEAARYMVMGVMAHKSALRDGEILDVPDFGDPPGA